jgi:hypothetical protein
MAYSKGEFDSGLVQSEAIRLIDSGNLPAALSYLKDSGDAASLSKSYADLFKRSTTSARAYRRCLPLHAPLRLR